MATMPANSHPLPVFPLSDVGANRIDPPRDLMPGHSRVLQTREESFFSQYVAMTDSTGLNLYPHLCAPRFRHRPLDNFEVSTWLAYLHHFHAFLTILRKL
jgi:hypothetical protein